MDILIADLNRIIAPAEAKAKELSQLASAAPPF